MKVLITSPSLDENENVSGISTMIANIIEHSGCEFVHFKAGRKDGEKFNLGWIASQLKLPFAFRRAIARSDPEIIHINTAFEPRAIVRDLALAKFAGNRPIILHVHGGRFVMEDFPNPMLAALARMLLGTAARVVVLGDSEAERISQFLPGLKTAVLANAISLKDFPEADRPRGAKKIVYLGRLQEAKGLSEMVEACRLLRAQGFKFKFSCFGTGPDEKEFIRRMTAVLGDDFYYGGVISGAEKVTALNSADIFLMPSRFEGLPLALLEAMAAGCVPIVSNRGSIPSVVEDGRNGFLVDPGDITQIVGRLKFLLSEGETGWNEYRRNARETIRAHFDIASYSQKLKNLYAEISPMKPQ
ncbi:MAG: glycosyltransferase family 4 protein [Pyrinomonadaceae bacterium]